MDKKRKSYESLLIKAHNAINTDYIKVKTDHAQLNSKFRLCGERNKTFNKIISECSKLVKKWSTRLGTTGCVKSLGTLQVIQIIPYYQVVYAQTRISPSK